MTTTPNEADPRVKRTRQMLYQALMELWHEKGLRAITVQDITERAAINRATFYAHFQDKFDLLASCLRDQFRHTVAQHVSANASWSSENLHRLILTIFEFLAETHHDCAPADQEFDSLFEMTLQQEVSGILRSWFNDPTFPGGPAGVTNETLATLWTSAIFGVATQWNLGSHSVPAGEMVRQVMITLTPSLQRAAQTTLR